MFKAILCFWLVLWKVFQRFRRDFAPLLVFFPAIVFAILGTLQLYDLVPSALDDESETRAELRFILVWMILFFGNYNSFVITVSVVAFLLPLNFMIILRLVEKHADPDASDHDKQIDLSEFLNQLAVAVIFFLIHTYTQIKELSLLAIKHHLLQESSGLLKDYLLNAFNATLILNSENEVILSNKKADELLQLDEEGKKAFYRREIFELVHGSTSNTNLSATQMSDENVAKQSLEQLKRSN